MHELPAPPEPATVDRVRRVVVAGHRGDDALAASHLHDEDPTVRVAALGAVHRCGRLDVALIRAAFVDPSPRVRARAAELSVDVEGIDPDLLLLDHEPSVIEVASFACGESRWPPGGAPVDRLSTIARDHEDPLCRESAAAALGAIGDPRGLDAVLAACDDRVTVRRRAILALAAFDDPRAEAMLLRALEDKDWQVRQAAEDLLEIGRSLDGDPDPDAYAE